MTASTGRIYLNGTSGQTLTGTGNYINLELDNAAGASLATSAASFTISGTLTLTSGNLTLNTNTLTLSGNIAATGTGTLTGSTTSNITVSGTTGSVGTLNFTTGSQNLGNLTMSRTGGANPAATLGTNLSLNAATALTLTNGILSIGSNTLTYISNTAFRQAVRPRMSPCLEAPEHQEAFSGI